jgi:hypothetical protein
VLCSRTRIRCASSKRLSCRDPHDLDSDRRTARSASLDGIELGITSDAVFDLQTFPSKLVIGGGTRRSPGARPRQSRQGAFLPRQTTVTSLPNAAKRPANSIAMCPAAGPELAFGPKPEIWPHAKPVDAPYVFCVAENSTCRSAGGL